MKRLDNGNIEINLKISGDLVIKTRQEVLAEIAKETTIQGFRKGKAPIEKVLQNVSDEKLTEHVLSHILPESFAKACEEHKIRPAMYPKFEAVKITAAKNVSKDDYWEIKAITCELPNVELGKYKSKLKKDDKDETVLIKSLLEAVSLRIPEILISEEVNIKLSQVLQRIEKLGLTLEGYLKSVGKTVESLRSEYTDQAISAISLELILNKIADEEKIVVEEKEIDELIKGTGENSKASKDQRDMIRRVILRRKALEKITPK